MVREYDFNPFKFFETCFIAQTWSILVNVLSPVKKKILWATFKMVEEYDIEITFFPQNTSNIHLQGEQLLENTY